MKATEYKNAVLKMFPNARKETKGNKHVVCLEPEDTYESASYKGTCANAKEAWRYAALIDAPARKAELHKAPFEIGDEIVCVGDANRTGRVVMVSYEGSDRGRGKTWDWQITIPGYTAPSYFFRRVETNGL